jgi:hypothetical protein
MVPATNRPLVRLGEAAGEPAAAGNVGVMSVLTAVAESYAFLAWDEVAGRRSARCLRHSHCGVNITEPSSGRWQCHRPEECQLTSTVAILRPGDVGRHDRRNSQWVIDGREGSTLQEASTGVCELCANISETPVHNRSDSNHFVSAAAVPLFRRSDLIPYANHAGRRVLTETAKKWNCLQNSAGIGG